MGYLFAIWIEHLTLLKIFHIRRTIPHPQPLLAKALKLTAEDLKKLNIIDEIIQEPLGGAHRDYDKSLSLLGDSIELQLNKLLELDTQELKIMKQNKYLKIT